jgi:hypothetical protein
MVIWQFHCSFLLTFSYVVHGVFFDNPDYSMDTLYATSVITIDFPPAASRGRLRRETATQDNARAFLDPET